jgi:putative membrane protein
MNLNEALALSNACLSATSIVCMTLAFRAIRAKRVARHRSLMLVAVAASALFLALFVARFVRYGFAPFEGKGPLRVVYYAVFFSHEPVAVISVPLVVCAVVLGLKKSFHAHREVARIALPIWLYATVTGDALYLLLYPLRTTH